MKDLFRKAGRVLHTDIHTDEGSRRPNGNGTVIVDDPRTARAAIGNFLKFVTRQLVTDRHAMFDRVIGWL